VHQVIIQIVLLFLAALLQDVQSPHVLFSRGVKEELEMDGWMDPLQSEKLNKE
jgi:hypothetical protein